TALRTAVAELGDEDFARPSGCTGWLVRDLVCHLIIDAQDVLITLVTPAESEPTRDAVTYWEVSDTPPTGDDPLDALVVRLAAAGGPRPVPPDAGEDRRGRVPRVDVRHRHAPGRHRTPCPDRLAERRPRCAGRETPTRPRMIVVGARRPSRAHPAPARTGRM